MKIRIQRKIDKIVLIRTHFDIMTSTNLYSQTKEQQAKFYAKLASMFLNVNKIFSSEELFMRLSEEERNLAVMCAAKTSSIPSRYSNMTNDEFENEAFEVYNGRRDLKLD